jgi:hypothetical protein
MLFDHDQQVQIVDY